MTNPREFRDGNLGMGYWVGCSKPHPHPAVKSEVVNTPKNAVHKLHSVMVLYTPLESLRYLSMIIMLRIIQYNVRF